MRSPGLSAFSQLGSPFARALLIRTFASGPSIDSGMTTQQVPAPRARVFQSPRYVQKAGLVREVSSVVKQTFPKLGRASVVVDPRLRDTPAAKALLASFPDPHVEAAGRECSRREVDRVAASCGKSGVDHVVCYGGGKTVDLGKLVADTLEVKSIVVPSIASNDAPCTALSVLYTDEGQFDQYVTFKKSPDMVLVDTEVILQSPLRFLVSGMGDALSTFYEARACCNNPQAWSLIAPFGAYRPPAMALAIGRQCHDILVKYGPGALRASKEEKMNAAFEEVVEANILMSGLGAESGGLAAAHAIHNALAELPETHGMLHGEKVAFGTLAQLMMEGDREEAVRAATFCKAVGLPTRFKDLGITEMSTDKLQRVANHCMDPSTTMWNMGPHVTPELIINAMSQADALGASLEFHKC